MKNTFLLSQDILLYYPWSNCLQLSLKNSVKPFFFQSLWALFFVETQPLGVNFGIKAKVGKIEWGDRISPNEAFLWLPSDGEKTFTKEFAFRMSGFCMSMTAFYSIKKSLWIVNNNRKYCSKSKLCDILFRKYDTFLDCISFIFWLKPDTCICNVDWWRH